MANREKGEVSLTVGETSYTLVLSFNAMIEAEDKSEAIYGRRMTWDEISEQAGKFGDLRGLRLMMWALFTKHHPTMSVADVGALIDDVGGLPGLQNILRSTFGASTPDPKDLKAIGGGKPARPRKAQAHGAGVNSVSPPAALA